MAGDAGKRLVSIVREGVDDCGGGAWCWRRVIEKRPVPLPLHRAQPLVRRRQRNASQCRRRVERQRRRHAPRLARLYRCVAPGAVARVHTRLMRQVAGGTVLRQPPMVAARVERDLAPVAVTRRGGTARLGLGGAFLRVRGVGRAPGAAGGGGGPGGAREETPEVPP